MQPKAERGRRKGGPIAVLRTRLRQLEETVEDLEERVEMLELSEHDHDIEDEANDDSAA